MKYICIHVDLFSEGIAIEILLCVVIICIHIALGLALVGVCSFDM